MDLEVADDLLFRHAVIKVVGCGGAGNNAVDRMITSGLENVDYIAVNTDFQDLEVSKAPTKILLGRKVTGGLGAGNNPITGEKAAEEDVEIIKKYLRGADMVFLTAGMGGGTGTGATPVIARIAMELGCLTVAIVTMPFHYEDKQKMTQAESGIEKLKPHVDTLIKMSNQNLIDNGHGQMTIKESFLKIDEILHLAVQGITDLVTKRGLINIDFADLETTMKGQGASLMCIGQGKGSNRFVQAARAAITHPMFDGVKIDGAKNILVNIRSSTDISPNALNETIKIITEKADPDVNFKHGLILDEELEDEVMITVIATGLGEKKITETVNREPVSNRTLIPPDTNSNLNNMELSFSQWNAFINKRGISAGLPTSNSLKTPSNHVDLNEKDSSEDVLIPSFYRRNKPEKNGE